MSMFLGQVPEDVDQLANEFNLQANEIETIIQAITAKLDGTNWVGNDRDIFEATWKGESTNNLNMFAQTLRETATIASKNAEQQRIASS